MSSVSGVSNAAAYTPVINPAGQIKKADRTQQAPPPVNSAVSAPKDADGDHDGRLNTLA